MKFRIPILLTLATLLIAGVFLLQQPKTERPAPTDTIIKEGEDGDNQLKREVWIENMHRTAEGTNWREMEYMTQMNRHRLRAESGISARNECEDEWVADGLINGRWAERGSINQAGSVFDIEYDPVADRIWCISAGGSLFTSDRYGLSWEIVNQDLRFSPGILKFIQTDNGRRMIAFINEIPHYSDDDGLTWTAASGISHNDSWGTFHHPVITTDDDGNHTIYVLAKPSYWTNFTLYRSQDNGETYQSLSQLSSNFADRFALTIPHHSQEVLLAEKRDDESGRIYRINPENGALTWLNADGQSFGFGSERANITAWSDDETTRIYAYVGDDTENIQVMQSTDMGITWTNMGQMPTRPWSVAMYVMPSNPDVLMYGEVECYRSTDAGATWEKINDWWEYYDQVDSKIHADIMDFNEFETADGDPFLYVSNHGGITYTTNYMVNQINIGMEGLNVSQYYSVRTDPSNPEYVYAGSQDQGFQRSSTFTGASADVEFFNQVISGDYGHIVFSSDDGLWTVYPGGWVTYYQSPQFGGYTTSYDLQSENESVWLPPLMASSNEDEVAIYMAGGNMDGGAGSRIIKLNYENGVITPSQSEFDFLNEGGGEVSALGNTPLNPNKMYAATTNGRFFYSNDGGDSWDQTAIFLPGGHYLYGQAILGSKVDENTVYLGGSGYDNPAFYRSTDGGQTFVDKSEGLPSTLIFDLASNEDESLIFAATEAGPYVYITDQEQWFDLSGFCAPAQTYWSVEFVESDNTARFGTYGRGIWDFQVNELVNSTEVAKEVAALEVFPNPGNGNFSWRLANIQHQEVQVQVFDLNGKLLRQQAYQTAVGQSLETPLDLTSQPSGNYILVVRDGRQVFTEQLIIQR